MKKLILVLSLLAVCANIICNAQTGKAPRFKVLVLAENGGHHILFTKAVKPWLNQLAADSSFSVDYVETAAVIDEPYLSKYQLFIQLDYPPYGWGEKAMAAF